MMKRLLSIFVLSCLGLMAFAQDGVDVDSIYVSLFTCSPGNEAYTLFGHTAIRVKTSEADMDDIAFNYGMFHYNSKNFIYRFVKGETDYELGAEPVSHFLERYQMRGYSVLEQELALTHTEKLQLLRLLRINYEPRNRIYRYNFLYDNCTTRARDIIQSALEADGKQLQFNPHPLSETVTFRDVLHQFTAAAPWTGFGIDMVLGSEVDRPLSRHMRMFIPSIYSDECKQAVVLGDTINRSSLVRSERLWEPMIPMAAAPDFPLSPQVTMYLVLALVFVLTVVDMRRRRLSLWIDVLLLLLQGAAGCIIAFLYFFSEHPAVGTNWLVVAFNPLAWLLLIDIACRVKGGVKEGVKRGVKTGVKGGVKTGVKGGVKVGGLLEAANLTVLVFTLLLFCLPLQWLHPALLPVVLTLLLRSLVRLKINI